ncbi:MAG: ABC transporter permease, partial [Deltaproteobacteria bacterium]|nr:ABC transporter permease [Deltaproteobacteria bacterium]
MTEKDIDIYIELPERRYLEAWRMFKGNKAAVLGLCMWGMIIFIALFGSLIYQVDPFELVGEPMTAPDSEYLFGTDYLGRDVLAGI